MYVCDVDLESREKTDPESVHIINIDIQDNQEEATIGAFMICDLCTLVRRTQNCICTTAGHSMPISFIDIIYYYGYWQFC